MLACIDEIDRGIGIAAGVAPDKMPTRVMKGNASPLVNDPALVERINPALTELLGPANVVDQFPSVMGSEDFQEAFKPMGMLPYAFFQIGAAPAELFAKGRAEGRPAPYSNHHPDFFVDLAAISIGAKVDAVAASGILAKGAAGP